MTLNLPSKEDARLCASVVKEIARAKGIASDPAFISRLTATVARLFNRGVRDRDALLSEAMALAETPVARKERGALLDEFRNINPGTIDLSMEPENERGHQQQ
jgi:hypothetical protein